MDNTAVLAVGIRKRDRHPLAMVHDGLEAVVQQVSATTNMCQITRMNDIGVQCHRY